jgi:serine protease Do/serine protease DegQ
VNLKGELVGINTAIIGPSGGNVGIGFAVPVVLARAVMDQLVKFGEVRRGRLGISMTDVVGGEGATVAEVQADSPAAQAGLRKGDVVVALNGRPVRGAAELRARLGVVPVGESIELQVRRGGETRVVKAKVGAIEAGGASGGAALQELAGAVLQDVQRSGLPGGNRAVLVTAVKPESAAFRQGLRVGDLIVGVNGRRIGSTKELAAALRARSVQLHVVRGDSVLNIPVS